MSKASKDSQFYGKNNDTIDITFLTNTIDITLKMP
jgi:hypothetical protein